VRVCVTWFSIVSPSAAIELVWIDQNRSSPQEFSMNYWTSCDGIGVHKKRDLILRSRISMLFVYLEFSIYKN
jgi:hypothetical protein